MDAHWTESPASCDVGFSLGRRLRPAVHAVACRFPLCAILSIALHAASIACPQEPELEEPGLEVPEQDSGLVSSVVRTLEDTITPYGSLRVRLVHQDGDNELQNGSSRIGARMHREFDSGVSLIGRVEWQVNLVEDPTVLSGGDSTSSELQPRENADAFETRLGFLGFDMGQWGELTFGKQWGAYYDVAGWTDVFYAFGARALGVYPAGTDGGLTGTGRAEQAIVWRVDAGPWTLAAQVQARGLSAQDSESLGASVRCRVGERVQFGLAFNRAKLGDEDEDLVELDDDPTTILAGVRYEDERLVLAAAYSNQEQNGLGLRDDMPTLFDARGFETYVHYELTEQLGLFGGGNWLDADDSGYDRDSDVEDYYLGADWHFDDRTFVYVQGKLAEAGSGEDAVVLGLRYGF